MKTYKIISLLFISLFSIQSNTIGQNNSEDDDGIWTGTVTFLEKQTGKEIIISEWRMDAKISNNITAVIHSFTFKSTNGTTSDCKTEDKGELEVDIDYETGKYSIKVPMPGCYGKTISNGSTSDFSKTDETAIMINDQPLKDPNILEGILTEKTGGGDNENGTTTTYKWRLERKNKINIPVSQNNNKAKSSNTGTPKKETWTGTVTWIKTSGGIGKLVNDNNGHQEVHQYDNYFAYHTKADFINSKGTVSRADSSRKWEKDSLFYSNPNIYTTTESTEKIIRNGTGEFNLEVEFSEDKKTYWISFFGPICTEYYSFERNDQILGHSKDSSAKEDGGIQITLPAGFAGYPLGINPNLLIGKFEEIIPANPDDPTHAEIITRAKWELKKVK